MQREDVELWFVSNFVPVLREAIKEEAGDETPFEFLIGVDKWLVCIEQDYQVGMYKSKHMAIGSGALLALGALTILDTTDAGPEEKIVKSITVAAKYDKAVGGNITIVNTNNYDRNIFEMGELNE
jgi:20S proteasome alpha/beta subunit